MADISYQEIVNAWGEKKITTEADVGTVLSNYQIMFAYHSNRIEGSGLSLHDTREIFENGKAINYTGDTRALFETQNQKICFDFLKKKIVEKEDITPEFICDIHLLLNQGCYDTDRYEKGERPGQYKKHFYGVGECAGVLPEDVSEEVRFLCDEVRGQGSDMNQEQILTTAAYLHCNFESIHPYADGNGRTGRTLMNYYLMIHNLPPVIIFEEDKNTYYLALDIFDRTEELSGFVAFIKEEAIKTWTRKPPVKRKVPTRIICI